MKRLMALATVGLMACSTMQQPAALIPTQGGGVALISATVDSTDTLGAKAEADIRGIDDPGFRARVYASRRDVLRTTSAQSDPNGELAVLDLKPGRYVVAGAYTTWGGGGGPSVDSNARQAYIPIGREFEVKAGEVVYLGSLGFTLDNNERATVRDAWARDASHLQATRGIRQVDGLVTRLIAPDGTVFLRR
ncbi:hypothetical protein [Jeongeupia chitinilytica]|uniref:Carboxypeptidase regulatory-like domain-containing protein n=1 Tax=Jeongeupia chitinilytica TaxID=1041641 RepID=A0ABQ3H2Z7_9NEIS|nr:hypothetical protein [Jeongeupia chitinilytica]GHD63184.1 hypothetical protein GCM10007350_20120 [Jeongeupia chitinilytica]